MIELSENMYLIVATSHEEVAKIIDKQIYKITKCKIIPLIKNKKTVRENKHSIKKKIIK